VTKPPDNNLKAAYDMYEAFMGRWSRQVAAQFVDWLEPSNGIDWLDVGCGAGMLSQTVVEQCDPNSVTGVDPSETYITVARAHAANTPISFEIGDAQELPFENNRFDMVVSGLMIKFVPDKLQALSEMKRVARPGGEVALYDWDLEHNLNMTRHFWQAVADVAPELIEGRATDRPPMKETATVADRFVEAGLAQVEEKAFSFTAEFSDFDDYWHPLIHNRQNVGRFCETLSGEQLCIIATQVKEILPMANDGSISFESRASAIKARA
jgi:ubiquinone/menaquinone biosynthesis C-methylase UbiE